MYSEMFSASQIFKIDMQRLEKKLRQTWRNEKLEPRRKPGTSVLLTALLGLFIVR